jgi:chromosomal replication initiator protein
MLHYRIMSYEPKLTKQSMVHKACDLINKYDLSTRSRKREVSYPRHYMAFYMYRKLGLTTTLTATLLGRDHATILHSCKVVNDLENDKYFQEVIREFKEDLIKTMSTLEC